MKKKDKFFIFGLIVVILLSTVVAVTCSVGINPEVKFWSELFDMKDQEISELKGEKIIFTGGSSCTFSVSPTIVSQSLGKSAYNFGGSAFMGARYIFERVKRHVGEGDVLVLGFEPEILIGLDGTKPFPLGRRMAIYNRDLGMVKSLKTENGNLGGWLSVARPGLRNIVVMTGRKILGGKSYAYSMDDRKDLGRLELGVVEFKRPAAAKVDKIIIDENAIRFLEEIVSYCKARGARCVYALPWFAVQTDIVEEAREKRKTLMLAMANIMPVLADDRYGILDGMDGFSDSEYHMGAELSAERSRFLASKLEPILSQK